MSSLVHRPLSTRQPLWCHPLIKVDVRFSSLFTKLSVEIAFSTAALVL